MPRDIDHSRCLTCISYVLLCVKDLRLLLFYSRLLRWDLILGATMKWLLYDDLTKVYNNENPHLKFRMILLGELGAFLNLKAAENHFSPENPEFSIQLLVEDSTLDVSKDLLSCRGEGYAINNLLRSLNQSSCRTLSTAATPTA